MADIADRIETRLRSALQPEHLELTNESHLHAGPATDSHFKLVVVAADFDGNSRVKRHQMIYRLLHDELQASGRGGSVHALALHLYTPQEWSIAAVQASPRCAGRNVHTVSS